jgi:hypothetical protein
MSEKDQEMGPGSAEELKCYNPPQAISEEDLRFFLHLGYFPNFDEEICPIDLDCHAQENLPDSEGEFIVEAKRLFLHGIAEYYKPGADIVVPLSGGLDSRAILAGLLEFRDARQIATMTYGTPNTLDYEIGNAVARYAGTRHQTLNLVERPCDLAELVATANRFRLQTVLFRHPRLSDFDKLFRGAQIWSGYVGDVIVGGHLHDQVCTVEKAKVNYVRRRRLGKSISLSGRTNAEIAGYIDFVPLENTRLSLGEQLIFKEGIYKSTAPQIIYSDHRYVTPFINNEFMKFFFSVPSGLRRDQRLFRSMLRKGFPRLFSLPAKSVYGGIICEPAWRTGIRKLGIRGRNYVRRALPWIPLDSDTMTNYLDFDRVSRPGGIYYDLFAECLNDLARRDLVSWLDVTALWEAHRKQKLNAGIELSILVSLEILIEAGKRL